MSIDTASIQRPVTVPGEASLEEGRSLASVYMVREAQDIYQIRRLIEDLIVVREVMEVSGIRDIETDIVLRDLVQEWASRIGFPPYDREFIERVYDRGHGIFRDHLRLLALENLIDIVSEYMYRPEELSREELIEFIREEFRDLGLEDLDIWERRDFIKYVSYAVYLLVVSGLGL